MKAIINGGDAAGMSAATKLKRINKDCDVIIYENGPYLSYSACGLPIFYCLSGDSKRFSNLRKKEQFEASG